jgi:hypothetical protein
MIFELIIEGPKLLPLVCLSKYFGTQGKNFGTYRKMSSGRVAEL